jgi:hypothetical protein
LVTTSPPWITAFAVRRALPLPLPFAFASRLNPYPPHLHHHHARAYLWTHLTHLGSFAFEKTDTEGVGSAVAQPLNANKTKGKRPIFT